MLARGDRRGFVVVDMNGKVYSLSRWLETKPKDLSAKLGDLALLPDVEEAQAAFDHEAENATSRNATPVFEESYREKCAALEQEKSRILSRQREERAVLEAKLSQRRRAKALERQAQLKTGLSGLWERLTGGRAPKLAAIQAALADDRIADNLERLAFSNRHLGEMRDVQRRMERLQTRWESELQAVHGEVAQEALARREAQIKDSALVALIRKDPLHALAVITDKSAVFTKSDITRILDRTIDAQDERNAALTKILSSNELVHHRP